MIVHAEGPKVRVIVTFSHPVYSGKKLPSIRKGTDPQPENITSAAYPEIDAAVAKDMQLFNDPMFSSYIRKKLKLLCNIDYNTFYKLYGQ